MHAFALPRFVPAAIAALTLCFSAAASSAKAATPLVAVHSTGTSSVTNIVDNPDGTMTLEADQTGKLGTLGAFNGHCTYVATFDTTLQQIRITGTGTFTLTDGSQLKLAISFTEFGLNYPIPFAGMISVTGGTGQCENASGYLVLHGVDEEALVDGINLDGFVFTPRCSR
ncbi:hypothetical protein DB347_05040 [Opitutaceae bacterium EW11]|nr:hypothetical protein DB347_05040 [Opitutaceae bacterium EW11]